MQSFRLEKYRAPQPSFWDQKYATEAIGMIDAEEYRRQGFWPLLKRELKKGERYLDIGCGVGGWLRFLRGQGFEVEGVEIAAQTVERLTQAGIDGVNVGSITALPYPDNSFEGAYALGVLEYVDGEVPTALSEVRRVLKPGGWFLLEVPIANVLRRLAYIPLKKLESALRPHFAKASRGRQAQFSNYLFDRKELRTLLEQAGFTIAIEQPHDLVEAGRHHGLWIDWPFLRGGKHSRLNLLGRVVERVANVVSPWVASTGTVMLARKIR